MGINFINKTFIIFSDNGSNIYNHNLEQRVYIANDNSSMYIPSGQLGTEEDDLHIFFIMLFMSKSNNLSFIKSYMIFSYDNMNWINEY